MDWAGRWCLDEEWNCGIEDRGGAAVGAGGFASVEQACTQSIQLANHTLPIAENVKRHAEYYQVYRSLYSALKPSFDTVTRLAAAGWT